MMGRREGGRVKGEVPGRVMGGREGGKVRGEVLGRVIRREVF